MIEHRPFSTLGGFRNHWLNARHHFSFGGYHDPKRVNWGALRVWNDDEIAAGTGFDPHPHRDMEIITYVRSGAITHQDSLGNQGRTEAGDVQVMSAGAGVVHAEYNRENTETRLFQIWIIPDQPGGDARWDTATFPKTDRSGRWVTLASGRPGDDALLIRADARVLGATLKAGERIDYAIEPDRKAYLVLAEGRARLGDLTLDARDGAAIADESLIALEAIEDAEAVLVDVS